MNIGGLRWSNLSKIYRKTGRIICHRTERTGGSPLGMKKPYPVVFDASAGEFEEIYVSGGRIGLTLKVPLADLLKVTGGKLADITMKTE